VRIYRRPLGFSCTLSSQTLFVPYDTPILPGFSLWYIAYNLVHFLLVHRQVEKAAFFNLTFSLAFAVM